MKKHKGLAAAIAAALLGIAAAVLLFTTPRELFLRKETDIPFRAKSRSFQQMADGQWQPLHLTGVNLGSGYPGSFPNEEAIPEQTYLRWFEMIGEMHANTIRVYQLQSPAFYSALVTHNETSPNKLYLLQNIDFPDQMMYSEENLLTSDELDTLLAQSRQLINAIHGNAIRFNEDNQSLNLYTADASPWLLGYNLGVEWDELFVEFTCRMNPGVPVYAGRYFRCRKNATPFESFLARWADEVFAYEVDRYARQPLISFANWAETDPLANELQIMSINKRIPKKNKETGIDVEHILPTADNRAGFFTSYNIYPYFPMFLQYGRYTQFVDHRGNCNPYQGYLTELVLHHSCPVVISEYGVPSSRSVAYRDIWRDFSHGGLNETQQGEAIVELHQDIVQAGCAGSLVFTWQDEWFKRTWNEMHLSDPDARPYWSNAQCVEQSFGLLSFDPGTPETIIYPDGDLSDWRPEDQVWHTADHSVSMRSDARYLYFLVTGLSRQNLQESIHLALDTTPKSGASHDGPHQFSRGVDFTIRIDPQEGELQVHAPYNLLIYSMGDKLRSSMSIYSVQELSNLYLHDWDEPAYWDTFQTVTRACGSIYGFMRHRYEVEPVGRLHPGNGNPDSPLFDSNADYCLRGDALELRIPWQLLNFRDPSRRLIVDNLQENDLNIKSLEIDQIYAAIYEDDQNDVHEFFSYTLTDWEKPQWHERLKQSYYILQKEFEGANAA